jgi:drug/metabolite transporter (DMT)-like permease
MMRGLRMASLPKQALGNALAGVLFLVIAIVDFTRDSSGIGVVFLVFAAVFLGLASSARKAATGEKN